MARLATDSWDILDGSGIGERRVNDVLDLLERFGTGGGGGGG
jgi:hypothetical protein